MKRDMILNIKYFIFIKWAAASNDKDDCTNKLHKSPACTNLPEHMKHIENCGYDDTYNRRNENCYNNYVNEEKILPVGCRGRILRTSQSLDHIYIPEKRNYGGLDIDLFLDSSSTYEGIEDRGYNSDVGYFENRNSDSHCSCNSRNTRTEKDNTEDVEKNTYCYEDDKKQDSNHFDEEKDCF
ncbi:hypothetical protein EDEG_01542 [Edhazardia aedis USNM 41457]|uniref:Uncharacterized protein n=1 Tax=Edhazardia aedis (strain USNM 41457) TaxID=1003232 RepID=J9DS88_EDHAE|nr:hypothetical protein EDEG_01542 [Edhazardia aedis USNM 41457]|eukprot:EJW04167.1 hypothetical protein EDEG_01542 [Edhazardia aedis USNM 41457]